jgi:hypothetical protein
VSGLNPKEKRLSDLHSIVKKIKIMKTKLFFSLAATAAIAGLVIACNKSNSAANGNSTPTTTGTTIVQVQTQAADETQISNEMDAAANDANNALNTQPSFSGNATTSYRNGVITDGGGGSSLNIDYGICDATVTADTTNGQREIIITYNGTNCAGNRTRTGVVTISMPLGIRWRDAGAAVTVSIQNLKITRLWDNKTIILNGTYVYTNVSGGLLRDLATLNTITHTIAADSVTIQFADSATRLWSIAKQRVFTYNDGVVITTTGTHSDGNNTDVSMWGTNRYGNSFETLIVQPMVIAQSCDYRLTSGQTETIRPAVTTTITYGLDSSGNPTTCPGNGYYYYKEVWVIDGKTYTWIAPY